MPGYPIDALLGQLRALADEKYRAFNESLTPGAEGRSFGVRMPALRKVARQILRKDPFGFLDASLQKPVHEISLLHAIVLSKADCPAEQRIARLRAFVPAIDNWAVCDLLCNDLKPAGSLLEDLLPFLKECIGSGREFEVRFGYVMLMLYYRSPEYIDETFRLYAAFSHEGYYARMGAAWGISFLYVDYPKRTLEFLRTDSLDRFTHNKAIRKCIESYRIPDEEKQRLKTLLR